MCGGARTPRIPYRPRRAPGALQFSALFHEPYGGHMHRSRLSTVVIDCKVDDIDSAAQFWSRALGKPIRPTTTENGHYRELATTREELIIFLQRVEHESRVHLDIESDDLEAEVKRLEALGAKRVAFIKRWW